MCLGFETNDIHKNMESDLTKKFTPKRKKLTKKNDQITGQYQYGNKLRGETSHSTQLKLENRNEKVKDREVNCV